MQRTKIAAFHIYTWVFNILFIIMEILPNIFRYYIFKCMLKNLGENSYIDYKSYIRYPQKVSIGSNVSINRGCNIIAGISSKDAEIDIKDNVAIGPNVTFFAAGHDHSKIDLPGTGEKITVHKYCWIGGNSTILQGVDVGEGCIIGACSVVTKSIPAYSIAAGNPARVIKKRELGK